MTYRIKLPWPHHATGNHIWRGDGRRRIYLSPQARDYRDRVVVACASAGVRCIDGPIRIDVEAYPPDRRRRDLDNLLKPLLDALTYARVWEDDCQVADLHIVRMPVVKGGELAVTWCAKGDSHD